MKHIINTFVSTMLQTLIAMLAIVGCLFVIYFLNRDTIDAFAYAATIQAGIFLKVTVGLLLFFASAAALLSLYTLNEREKTKRQEARLRSVDGDYRLQEYTQPNGETIVVNPNLIPQGWWQVGEDNQLSIPEMRPEHVAIFQTRAAVDIAQAMTPGDQVYREGSKNGLPPSMYRPVKPAPPTLKPPRIIGAEDAPSLPPAAPRVIVDPVAQIAAPQPAMLPMGQDHSGEIAIWDQRMDPHLRFHGKTQWTGKTNAMRLLAMGAYNSGQELWLLDHREFKDWNIYNGKVRMVNTMDGEAFVYAMDELYKLYKSRDKQLAAAGARNIAEAPQIGPRVVAFITEFGAACIDAKILGYDADLDARVEHITRQGGACGVHLVFEDQYVDVDLWPRGARVNATPVCGYVPRDAARLCGYNQAHELDKHQFHMNKMIFKTWDATPVEQKLIGQSPPTQIELAVENQTTVTDPALARQVLIDQGFIDVSSCTDVSIGGD